jgi:hypothetical protein
MKKSSKVSASDRLIERIYRQSCSGVQIDIMDIDKVFSVGHAGIADGLSVTDLTKVIVDFVQTIRKN